MEPKERIIVALDVDSAAKALVLAKLLKGHVGGFKIGFELIYSMLADMLEPNSFDSVRAHSATLELFSLLRGEVFMDVKFKDIGNTVANAMKAVARLKPKFINLHATGGPKMMQAARQALADARVEVPILAVTLLTSLDYDEMRAMGYFEHIIGSGDQEVDQTARKARLQGHVVDLAKSAQDCGLPGVIASAQEAAAIRAACGQQFLIVTPGIRLPEGDVHDQARVTTPAQALEAGADYTVIGRPITQPATGTPLEAVARILENMAGAKVG